MPDLLPLPMRQRQVHVSPTKNGDDVNGHELPTNTVRKAVMGPHLMDRLLQGSGSLRASEDVEVPRVTDDVEEIHIIRVGKEKERSEKRRKKEVKESAARGGGVSSQCSWRPQTIPRQ